jgi:hypothetical protein
MFATVSSSLTWGFSLREHRAFLEAQTARIPEIRSRSRSITAAAAEEEQSAKKSPNRFPDQFHIQAYFQMPE